MSFGFHSTAREVVRGIDLRGRQVVLTGASSGIGVETARALSEAGADLVLGVRDIAKAQGALQDIMLDAGGRIRIERLDLSDLGSVMDFAVKVTGPVDILIANGGVSKTPDSHLPNGLEVRFATNHLGHFLLAHCLKRQLAERGARIIVVSSAGHRGMPVNLHDLQWNARPHNDGAAYAESKSANILFAQEATRRWASEHIVAHAILPGSSLTGLQRHHGEALKRQIGFINLDGSVNERVKSAEQAASTSVWAAMTPELAGRGGLVLEDCAEALPVGPSTHAWAGFDASVADTETAWRLWEYSEKLITQMAGSLPPFEPRPLHVPSRDILIPSHLSDVARAYLSPRPALGAWPAISDKAGWRAYVSAADQSIAPLLQRMSAEAAPPAKERDAGGARVFDIVPPGSDPANSAIVLDIHGGALVFCGGDLCRMMGSGTATRLQRHVWAVDYRMPPDHPYPAGLDDCIAAYRALLRERSPNEIIVSGLSAGGNLAAALVLRARDEGLPLPAGLILGTPESDLTESGDSFRTNDGVDPGLSSLMHINLLYANGHDLRHPYLSPLFGDFGKGFPPTILTSGTRDLLLSNAVRMHRALRAADIPAELHITEAGPHTGFPGAPEGAEIDREVRRFIDRVLQPR